MPKPVYYSYAQPTKKCRHTKSPSGYVEWHEWAERKAKTHTQLKCPHCGFWKIWKRKVA